MITASDVFRHFGNKAKTAAALGITKQAVSQWDEEGPIPERHALRLRYELAPELFRAPKEDRPRV